MLLLALIFNTSYICIQQGSWFLSTNSQKIRYILNPMKGYIQSNCSYYRCPYSVGNIDYYTTAIAKSKSKEAQQVTKREKHILQMKANVKFIECLMNNKPVKASHN
jgi:hypothetical protein